MSLKDLVDVVSPDGVEEPEDILDAGRGLVFPDDSQTSHGDKNSIVIYKSKRFGDIKLQTADPNDGKDVQLFAHYLWNAGIRLAENISREDASNWSVTGHRVLELGAGVGLSGIVATKAGAEHVVISDYPTESILDNLRRNAENSIEASLQSKYKIQGYRWGDLEGEFAAKNRHQFSRILAADCYWMPGEHENLVHSMLHFLDESPHARAFAVAGLHTGRNHVAAFLDTALRLGLVTEVIYEQDANDVRRDWLTERDGGLENQSQRDKWLVVARLKRASQGVMTAEST